MTAPLTAADTHVASLLVTQVDLTRERLLGMAEGRMLTAFDHVEKALATLRAELDRIERATAEGADPHRYACDPGRFSVEAVVIADRLAVLAALARHPEQQERAA